jgi:hypothetical protein
MYQTPGGLDRHGPQHAASLPSSSAPLRTHSVRAMRLVVAAGAWGAGLCLTFGLVALVATHGPTPGPPSVAVGDDSAKHLLKGARASFGTFKQRTFRGTGDGGGYFFMAAESQWHLHWAYHCTDTQARTFLAISQPESATEVSVRAAGVSGSGSTWAYSASSKNVFDVTSDCVWSVTVTFRR